MLSVWGNPSEGKSFTISLVVMGGYVHNRDVLVFAADYDAALELAREQAAALGLEPRSFKHLN